MADRFHAQISFHARREVIRFTTVDFDKLIARFNTEVQNELQRRRDAREYTVVIPNLTTEWCRSWSEFDQYEHC